MVHFQTEENKSSRDDGEALGKNLNALLIDANSFNHYKLLLCVVLNEEQKYYFIGHGKNNCKSVFQSLLPHVMKILL